MRFWIFKIKTSEI